MQLSCPTPQFDFDVITLGHGSGGLLTHRLLQRGVFDILGNEFLGQQHDGASFRLDGKLAFSTDSFVVQPIFFPGGSIGDLAINGTVNDLAMCGAKPHYLSLSFILEEGLPTGDFARILADIRTAAEKAGVQIVTGDTKVVEKGKGDKLFINTSGIGVVHPDAAIHHRYIQPGDRVIISGNIATHGMAIMSVREGLEFETDIVSDTVALNHSVYSLVEKFGAGIRFLRDPTRGGLASVLNEVAELTGTGIDLVQQLIPVDSQVEAACEMLGLDPLYVANEGIFLAIVAGDIAGDFLRELKQDELGKNAAEIGVVTSGHARKVLLQSRIGGSRVVNYLTGEQLPRIC